MEEKQLELPVVAVQQDPDEEGEHEGAFFPMHSFLGWALDWRATYARPAHRAILRAGKAQPVCGEYAVRFYDAEASTPLGIFSWVWKGKRPTEIALACRDQCKRWPFSERNHRWASAEAERECAEPVVFAFVPRGGGGSKGPLGAFFLRSDDAEPLDLALARRFALSSEPEKHRTGSYDLYLTFGSREENTVERAKRWTEEEAWPQLVDQWRAAWRDEVKSRAKQVSERVAATSSPPPSLLYRPEDAEEEEGEEEEEAPKRGRRRRRVAVRDRVHAKRRQEMPL